MTGPEYVGRHRQAGTDQARGLNKSKALDKSKALNGQTLDKSKALDGSQTLDGAEPGVLAAQVIVIAKEPLPGRVKTRLTPPYTSAQAAALAKASLCDTLAAVGDAPVARRVLALAGKPGDWLPSGFDVIAQRGGGLDERIAWALEDAWTSWPVPVVLIGMDTPQVTPELLAAAAEPLVSGTADATFGLAEDGGFWLLGLRETDPALLLGVPMSRPDTGSQQLLRLEQAGLSVQTVPALIDVDTAAEAERIAATTPGSRFAACLRSIQNGAQPSPAGAAAA